MKVEICLSVRAPFNQSVAKDGPYFGRISSRLAPNRAVELKSNVSKFSWNLPSQSVVRLKDDEMATLSQQSPYRCDQCGTPDIVAVPLVYQQGTRTYANPFGWGSSQSHSAQAASPPRRRSYLRSFLLWGPPTSLFFLWSYAGISAMLEHRNVRRSAQEEMAVFLFLGLICLGGLVISATRIYRYNRRVYPQAQWDWEHTYMCRRCGSRLLISS